jgi:Putative zinc-finger
MTFQVPQSQNHVADLLPAYINGTLDGPTSERVHAHLLHCKACQSELSSWEVVRDAAQFATAATPLPSANVLNAVWAKIDASPRQVSIGQWFLKHALHLWLVFRRQVPLVYKSIWIGSALVILGGCGLVLFSMLQLHNHSRDAEAALALIATVTSAAGVAFIYGRDNDAGLEITLSTPTSIRIVMFCRLLLVLGYDFALSALASIVVAVAHGGSLWEIFQMWLGPMLLLSSITLTLSLLIGSWFAIMAALVLEALQDLPLYVERHAPLLQFANPGMWQTSPTVLFLAVLLIIFAVFYAPRQPRLSN